LPADAPTGDIGRGPLLAEDRGDALAAASAGAGDERDAAAKATMHSRSVFTSTPSLISLFVSQR
jgi:hypothetical protein